MQKQDRLQPAKAWLPVQPDIRTTRTPADPSPLLHLSDPAGNAPDHGRIEETDNARGWRSLFVTVGGLALLWVGLAGPDPASWVIGAPVIAAATALSFAFPPTRRVRVAPLGAIRFIGWFAVASLRGAIDVAGRALAWRMPLVPGVRSYDTDLPSGAPRLVFVNAITLLPGTLSAEITDARVDVHMLDTRVDLAAELAPLEARVRALFTLPAASSKTPFKNSLDMEIRK